MDIVFEYMEILVVAVIIIAQVIAGLYAKRKKQVRRQEADLNTEGMPQQKPQTTVKTNAAAKPPSRRKQQKNQGSNFVTAAKANENKRKKNISSEEEEAAQYGNDAPEKEDFKKNILTAQARAGVIWSEILQPPVSVR